MAKKTQTKTQKKTTVKRTKQPVVKATVKRTPAVGKKAAKSASSTTTRSPQKTTGLTEGALAPSFTLQRDGGQSVSLKDYAGKKVVLFFYPRADTPGCTLEASDFSRLAKDFTASGTVVLGVSADSVKKQDSFRNKHQLSVPLLSDEKQVMLKRYGVWGEKSMYGKVFMGIVRTTVLIGRDSKIVHIWRNVRVDGHAKEVLETARAI